MMVVAQSKAIKRKVSSCEEPDIDGPSLSKGKEKKTNFH